MDEKIEKAYSPKEVFTTFDIGDSTLRKWCLALERNGYGFIRNDKKNRIYVESDLVVLRHFQKLLKELNMQLDNAAILVIDRFGKGAFEVGTDIVPGEESPFETSTVPVPVQNSEDIKELKEMILEQNKLIQNLVSRLDQQQKHVDERDKKLMESIRQMQEDRKQQLQLAAAQEERNKKWWQRLFK